MSNVAIKLVAVTGVVGLGVLMFLQAQKGIQSGENENQYSQYEVLNGDDANPDSLGTTEELTVESNALNQNSKTNGIPFSEVPAELSELASRIAAPIKKASETPFSPNKKTSTPKIKLTSGTQESTGEALEQNPRTPSETAMKKTLGAPLDFRTVPKPNSSEVPENPFIDSTKTPTEEPAKIEPPTFAQTDFKSGPQFGPPIQSDVSVVDGNTKTSIPPRETIKMETVPANPFAEKPTKKANPELAPVPDQLAFGDEQPPKADFFESENNVPTPKIKPTDSPFEFQPEKTPNTPDIQENPFQTSPKKPDATSTPKLPAPQTLTPEVEPEFNPFGDEPKETKKPAFESTPEMNKPLPIISENKERAFEALPTEPVKPKLNSIRSSIEKEPIRKPLSAKSSPDVVVIKKRKANPSPNEPSLFNINSQPKISGGQKSKPIAISPTPKAKPLSLVEGKQLELQAPAKPILKQKIQSPKMTIQKVAPPEAVLGQPFIYHVIVKNSGTTSAQDVVVEDRIPKGAKLTGTIPRAEQMNDRIIWRLGAMDPGTEKKISIRVIPEQAGPIGSVATVNFVTKVASETKITAPQLTLKTDQPTAVKPGEITVVNYTITNSGTGEAKNVFLRSIIPPQFSHPGGDDIEYSVGVIPAGQTKQVQLKLKAIKPGAGKNISSVMGDGNLKVAKEIPLKVIGTSEQFLLTRKGPENRYLGQIGSYENVVTNNSEKSIQNISVFESVPRGMKFVSATANGQFDPVRNVVQWDIPELASGDRQVLTIKLEPIDIGKMISTVQIITDTNTKHSASLQSETTIIGQPLLKVETSELKGPLTIGEKMTMQMQLTNQGNASATKVECRIKVPKELVFLAAKGPVRYKQVGSYIIFEPAQELAAKQSINFELTFAAQNKGEANVLVQVQSQQMEKPLSQEEAISVLDKL